jgi:hypothetical protein
MDFTPDCPSSHARMMSHQHPPQLPAAVPGTRVHAARSSAHSQPRCIRGCRACYRQHGQRPAQICARWGPTAHEARGTRCNPALSPPAAFSDPSAARRAQAHARPPACFRLTRRLTTAGAAVQAATHRAGSGCQRARSGAGTARPGRRRTARRRAGRTRGCAGRLRAGLEVVGEQALPAALPAVQPTLTLTIPKTLTCSRSGYA